MTDQDLFAAVRRELFVALVGDILDGLGLETQFLSPSLKPVDPTMVILGRAMTVVEQDIPPDRPPESPSGACSRRLTI